MYNFRLIQNQELPNKMSETLPLMLQLAVPLWIAKINKKIKNNSDYCPQEELIEALQKHIKLAGGKPITIAEAIFSHGDILLYGGKPGDASTIFNLLAETLALMAFIPGGVHFGDLYWEIKP